MESAVEILAGRHESGVAFQMNYQSLGSRRGSILGATPL